VVVGSLVARRSGVDVAVLMDCVAPGLLVAQAIGRLGNWWNQELYGKPTDLPWALEIDLNHRVGSYLDPATTFQPTFLYDLIWDLLAAGLLLLLARRFRMRPPGLFALYVALYCFGRFWIEMLRIDPAHHLGGLRLNDWVALLGILGGLFWFVRTQRHGGRRQRRPLRMRRKRPPPAPSHTMAVPRGRVRRGR